jgi:hypothetical protein
MAARTRPRGADDGALEGDGLSKMDVKLRTRRPLRGRQQAAEHYPHLLEITVSKAVMKFVQKRCGSPIPPAKNTFVSGAISRRRDISVGRKDVYNVQSKLPALQVPRGADDGALAIFSAIPDTSYFREPHCYFFTLKNFFRFAKPFTAISLRVGSMRRQMAAARAITFTSVVKDSMTMSWS